MQPETHGKRVKILPRPKLLVTPSSWSGRMRAASRAAWGPRAVVLPLSRSLMLLQRHGDDEDRLTVRPLSISTSSGAAPLHQSSQFTAGHCSHGWAPLLASGHQEPGCVSPWTSQSGTRPFDSFTGFNRDRSVGDFNWTERFEWDRTGTAGPRRQVFMRST